MVIISILIIIVKTLLSRHWFELEKMNFKHLFKVDVQGRMESSERSRLDPLIVPITPPRQNQSEKHINAWDSINYVSHRQQYKHNHAVCSIEVILIAVYETNYGFHIGDFKKFIPVLFQQSPTVNEKSFVYFE